VTDQPRTDPEHTERNRGELDPDPAAGSDRERAPEAERSASDGGRSQEPDARDHDDPSRRDSEDPNRRERDNPETRDREDTDRGHRQSDARDGDTGRSGLVGTDERAELRERWDAIQTSFIDDPRAATAEADALLHETMKQLISRWEQDLSDVRHTWDSDEDRSTEDLRVTMRRYRDTLERLLSS
jgi:hypothetical protein